MLLFLQILFGVLAAGTGIGLIVDIAKNRMEDLKKATGKQWASGFAVGIVANFLDTLGCGSYAPSTFMYKLFNQIDDINIPGTLNVGDTFPVIFEAFIFTASVDVDPVFLLIMYVCAAAGSFGFATIVTKWPRNKIRWALGIIMIHALQKHWMGSVRYDRNSYNADWLEANRSCWSEHPLGRPDGHRFRSVCSMYGYLSSAWYRCYCRFPGIHGILCMSDACMLHRVHQNKTL